MLFPPEEALGEVAEYQGVSRQHEQRLGGRELAPDPRVADCLHGRAERGADEVAGAVLRQGVRLITLMGASGSPGSGEMPGAGDLSLVAVGG